MIQPLQARIEARPRSRSLIRMNRCPAKPKMAEGNVSDAITPARSMSLTRSSILQIPGRNCSKVIGPRWARPGSQLWKPSTPSRGTRSSLKTQ